MSSRPSVNGENAWAPFDASGVKWPGRRLRSVEMITQRPTTGSLRSSGIGVLETRAAVQEDANRVSLAQPFARGRAVERAQGRLGAGLQRAAAARDRRARRGEAALQLVLGHLL